MFARDRITDENVKEIKTEAKPKVAKLQKHAPADKKMSETKPKKLLKSSS